MTPARRRFTTTYAHDAPVLTARHAVWLDGGMSNIVGVSLPLTEYEPVPNAAAWMTMQEPMLPIIDDCLLSVTAVCHIDVTHTWVQLMQDLGFGAPAIEIHETHSPCPGIVRSN